MSMLALEAAVVSGYTSFEVAEQVPDTVYMEDPSEEVAVMEAEIPQAGPWSFIVMIILPLLIAVLIYVRIRAKQKRKQIITNCPYCGKEITPDSNYCEYCGKKIK